MSKSKTIKGISKEEINSIINDAVNNIIAELKNNNMLKDSLSYYKKVELLLYRYMDLKDAAIQKDEAIKELEQYGLQDKSKSIVVYSSTGGTAEGDRYTQLLEKYKLDKRDIERYLSMIESAINKIKGDKYYCIIESKYFSNSNKTDEDLAIELKKDRRTIIRNRKRIINKLITILFPESIKDIL